MDCENVFTQGDKTETENGAHNYYGITEPNGVPVGALPRTEKDPWPKDLFDYKSTVDRTES